MHLEIHNEIVNRMCFFCKNEKNFLKGRIIDAPLILGCTTQDPIEDGFISYSTFQCNSCGLVFTDAKLKELAYSSIHSEAIGGIWHEHHQQFGKFIKNSDVSLESVLEIGPSNNPILRSNTMYVDMFDEAPFELRENEFYHKGRFPEIEIEHKFDTIVASHVFEHSLEPDFFLKKCKELLNPKGSIFISIPDFLTWINNKYWNGITPEHQIYPTIYQIEQLCNNLGLDLSLQKFKGHSMFFQIKINGKNEIRATNNSKVDVGSWFLSIKNSVKNLERKLTKYDNKQVFIAGASHISQYPILMSQSIKDRINFVLDNSKSKHGKRLYGTQVYCKPFEFISKTENPLIAVFSSPYQKEMIKQIMSINKKATVIEC